MHQQSPLKAPQIVEPKPLRFGLAAGRLYTPEETAQFLNLRNPKTLAVWRSTKRYPELKAYKVGRFVRYAGESIEAFLLAREA